MYPLRLLDASPGAKKEKDSMTPKQTIATAAAAVVAAAALVVVRLITLPTTPTMTPLPQITLDTGCAQTFTGPTVYTNGWVLKVHQWGFAGVNGFSGLPIVRNGVGKTGSTFCSPIIVVEGDCWQSVTDMAASPNVEKWVVAAGTSPQCKKPCSPKPCPGAIVLGLQVWKWNGTTFAWAGLISDGAIARQGLGMEAPRLDGDIAYAVRQWSGSGPKYWDKFDLNAMTVVASSILVPATPPIQANIQGYTYSFVPVPPSPYHKYSAVRVGGLPPTPSPVQTPAPTPVATPGCCPPPVPCPTCRPLTSFLRQAIEGIS